MDYGWTFVGEVPRIHLLGTQVNSPVVGSVDNHPPEAYTAEEQQNAKTPSPRVAPGGGGPTSDRTGSRGESLVRA
jgi:hypothetical protein